MTAPLEILGCQMRFGGGHSPQAGPLARGLGRENGEPGLYAVPWACACEAMGFVFGTAGSNDSTQSDIRPSLRIMANQDIGRLDLDWSQDDAAAWLVYEHPF